MSPEGAPAESGPADTGPSDNGRSHDLDPRLLELLVCPLTKGPLVYRREAGELLSKKARLAYPIRDGVPIMLSDEARALSDEEVNGL